VALVWGGVLLKNLTRDSLMPSRPGRASAARSGRNAIALWGANATVIYCAEPGRIACAILISKALTLQEGG
jgi:hypothetical protein